VLLRGKNEKRCVHLEGNKKLKGGGGAQKKREGLILRRLYLKKITKRDVAPFLSRGETIACPKTYRGGVPNFNSTRKSRNSEKQCETRRKSLPSRALREERRKRALRVGGTAEEKKGRC